jgi:hypothetical protein
MRRACDDFASSQSLDEKGFFVWSSPGGDADPDDDGTRWRAKAHEGAGADEREPNRLKRQA